ncbi:MAG: hypothetical protein ACKKL5_03660 [Candidatus Komeilibacteria bacterium]
MVDFLDKKDNKKIEKSDTKGWSARLLQPLHKKDQAGKDLTVDLLAAGQGQAGADKIKKPAPKQNKNAADDKGAKLKVKAAPTSRPKDDDDEEGGFEVNLLPASLGFQSNKKIFLQLAGWALLAILVVAGISIIISIYGQSISDEAISLQEEIDYLDAQSRQYNQALALGTTLETKATAVDTLLRSHIYWTNFFTALEKVTLPKVYYQGFTASIISLDINLSSFAPTFTDVARQLVAYEKFPQVFSNYSVSEASLSKGVGVNYTARVTLDPTLFYDAAFIITPK